MSEKEAVNSSVASQDLSLCSSASQNLSERSSDTKMEDLLLSKKSKDVNRFAGWFISNIIVMSCSIAPFSCIVCSNKFVSLENAVDHVRGVHPDWEGLLGKFKNYENCETSIRLKLLCIY